MYIYVHICNYDLLIGLISMAMFGYFAEWTILTSYCTGCTRHTFYVWIFNQSDRYNG